MVSTDTSSPYAYTYSNATAGTHNFHAVATDNNSATTTSNTVTVTVTVNASPTISLSASDTSIHEGESVTLTASPSDTDGTIAKVEFYRNNSLVATVDESPYVYTYSDAEAGRQIFKAKATDDDGAATTSSEVTVEVNDYPSVSLSFSPSGTTIHEGDIVTLTASATDSDGTIASVKFYRQNTVLFTDTSSPYRYNWSAIAGTHTFKAVATDDDGAATTSDSVTVTVNDKPSVTLAASSTAIHEGQSVTLTATASDTDGTIASVKFYRNSSLVATDTTSPYSYTYSDAAAGNHDFHAVATDDDGASTTSSTVTVTVNAYPTVTLAASSTAIDEGDSVTLTATPSDTDGTIVSVVFYRNDTLVSSLTESPYTYVYSNAAAGSHDFHVVATDDDGASTTSSTVTVTVNAYPTVTLAASSAAIDEGDSVTLTATASDTDGTIAKVEFYRNDSLVATDDQSPYTYVYSNAPRGADLRGKGHR